MKNYWNIAGVGAIGCVIAGFFDRAALPTRLLLKDESQLNDYQSDGLTVVLDDEEFNCHPIALDINKVNEPIKFLIICVKVFDIVNVLLTLEKNLNEESIVILVHNGLGVLDEIKTKFPFLRIMLGVSTIGAYSDNRFVTRSSVNGKLYLGKLVGEFSKGEIKLVTDAFHQSLLPFQWEEKIHHIAWRKFGVNCVINILTAIYACKNGELLNYPERLKKMTDEIFQVMIAYELDISEEELLQAVNDVIVATKDLYSSMYEDVKNKRRTELPYLNEYLIKLAEKKNIPIKENLAVLEKFYQGVGRYCSRRA